VRRLCIDALFLLKVYLGSEFYPSVLETVGLPVPARHIRDFALINVYSSCKNCSSVALLDVHQLLANVVCKDVGAFGAKNVLIIFNIML
jgi:hypothetical protein